MKTIKLSNKKKKSKTPTHKEKKVIRKRCTKCGSSKPLDEFHKDKSKKHGRDPKCKSCKAKYYQENKEQIAEHYNKNWRPVKRVPELTGFNTKTNTKTNR